MNPREMRARAAQLRAEAQAIYDAVKGAADGRDFTADELQRYDAAMNEAEGLLQKAEAAEARDAKMTALERRLAAQPGRVSDPLLPHNDPANTRGGRHGYSVLKALRQADPSNKEERLDGLELEAHQELTKQRAAVGLRASRGVLIPWDLEVNVAQSRAFAARAGIEQRVLNITTGAGALQTVVSTTMIELLRNKALVFQLGARRLTGLEGTFVLPRQNAAGTFAWVTEGNAPPGSNATIDMVQFVPKTVGGFTDFSRKFLMQTSVDAEMFVREDLVTGLGLEIDRVVVNGAGVGAEPLGILQNSSITTVALGANGAAPTWDSVVQLEEQVATANADIGALAYLTNAKGRSKLKRTPKVSGYPTYIWDEGELNSYGGYASNQVPANLVKGTSGAVCSAMIFGNWSDIIVGFWSGIDTLIDPFTGGSAGNVRVIVLQDADIEIRHFGSFAKCTDIITT